MLKVKGLDEKITYNILETSKIDKVQKKKKKKKERKKTQMNFYNYLQI